VGSVVGFKGGEIIPSYLDAALWAARMPGSARFSVFGLWNLILRKSDEITAQGCGTAIRRRPENSKQEDAAGKKEGRSRLAAPFLFFSAPAITFRDYLEPWWTSPCFSSSAPCAAARRAVSRRKGEQET
jgi:hypothetical protein